MCHGYRETDWLRVAMAAELDGDEASTDEMDGSPSFLNEERQTDVEILTDGGTD